MPARPAPPSDTSPGDPYRRRERRRTQDVRAALLKSPPPRQPAATIAFTNRGGTERSVVVERKPTRRIPPGRPVTGRSFG